MSKKLEAYEPYKQYKSMLLPPLGLTKFKTAKDPDDEDKVKLVVKPGELFCRFAEGDDDVCGAHYLSTGALCNHIHIDHDRLTFPLPKGRSSNQAVTEMKEFFKGVMNKHERRTLRQDRPPSPKEDVPRLKSGKHIGDISQTGLARVCKDNGWPYPCFGCVTFGKNRCVWTKGTCQNQRKFNQEQWAKLDFPPAEAQDPQNTS